MAEKAPMGTISVQDPRTLVELLIALGPSHDGAVERDLRIAVQRQQDEIERLGKIEIAARALKFSAYPAHGRGFVLTVTDGNINDLEAALAGTR